MYNISVISKACGIQPHTLRAWETRYGLFSPGRDATGKRQYTEKDFEKAVALSVLVSEGHAISSLQDYSLDELKEMSHKSLGLKITLSTTNKDHLKNIFQFIESYRIDKVSQELTFLRAKFGVKDFVMQVLLPTLQEVGVMVARGKYTVTQEHIVSTIVRDQLSHLIIPNTEHAKHEFALATPEGNIHELSIGLANILCRSFKFHTRYLGAAHPADCLAQALNTLKSPHLVLGAVSSDSWNYEKQIISYLQDLDADLNYPLSVILGGGSKITFPEYEFIYEVTVMPTFDDFNDYLTGLL